MTNKELAAQCLIEAANILGDVDNSNVLEENGLLTAGAVLAIGGATAAASIYTIINGLKKEKQRKLDEQIKKQKDTERKEYLKRQKLTELSVVSNYTLDTTKKLINSAEVITCKKDIFTAAKKINASNNKISKYIRNLAKTKVNKMSDDAYRQLFDEYCAEINGYKEDIYDIRDDMTVEWINADKTEICKIVDDVFKSTLTINDMTHLEEIFKYDIDIEKLDCDLSLGISVILRNIKIKGWK